MSSLSEMPRRGELFSTVRIHTRGGKKGEGLSSSTEGIVRRRSERKGGGFSRTNIEERGPDNFFQKMRRPRLGTKEKKKNLLPPISEEPMGSTWRKASVASWPSYTPWKDGRSSQGLGEEMCLHDPEGKP